MACPSGALLELSPYIYIHSHHSGLKYKDRLDIIKKTMRSFVFTPRVVLFSSPRLDFNDQTSTAIQAMEGQSTVLGVDIMQTHAHTHKIALKKT